MPLYVYKCNNCEHQFEVRQRFSEEPLTVCPNCAGQIRRLITPVGVVFKGSGFYVTDSRNGKTSSLLNGNSHSNSDDKTEKSDTSEKKSDTTPVAATPANKSDTKSAASTSGASTT